VIVGHDTTVNVKFAVNIENSIKMRNPKFRAWDSKNKKFPFIGFHVMGEVSAFDLLEQYRLEEWDDIKISEWTGLVDKNGVDIYEGDIVKYQWELHDHDIEETTGEVFFEDGIFYFDREMSFATNDSNFRKDSIEVVGNIFENKN
jgi:uncharacterized phage protein (TIGR01671 family)